MYLGRNRLTQAEWAVKFPNDEHPEKDKANCAVLAHEAQILGKLNHANIIKLANFNPKGNYTPKDGEACS